MLLAVLRGRTYATRRSTVALLWVTLGRIALLRVAVLAGGRTVAGLLVTAFDPSQNLSKT